MTTPSTTSTKRRPFASTALMDPSSLNADTYSDLDETEQERLISSLTSSNETTNLFYTRVFTAIPLLATLPFWWHLVLLLLPVGGGGNGRRSGITFLPCVLGLTCLVGSAFVMGVLPVGVGRGVEREEGNGDGDGEEEEDGDAGGGGRGIGIGMGRRKGSYGGYGGYGTAMLKGGTLSDVAHAQAERRRAAHALSGGLLGVELPFVVPVDVQGPVGRWLQVVNGVIGAVLVVFAVLLMDSEAGEHGFWLLLLLPGVVVAVVAVVRSAMAETEKGLKELGGLRYDYKGA